MNDEGIDLPDGVRLINDDDIAALPANDAVPPPSEDQLEELDVQRRAEEAAGLEDQIRRSLDA